MKNFGKIKNAFNEILAEGIVYKDAEKKAIFKKYIKTIKENKALKTQFLIYNNIENRVDSNELSANIFIIENLNLLNTIKKEDLLKSNKALINLSPLVSEKLKSEYDVKISKLHEALSNLIFSDTTIRNINQITENKFTIIHFIKENTGRIIEESENVPNSMLSSIIVDKFNEKYSDLTEEERKIIKIIIESNDIEKVNLYKSTLTECISLIDSKLPNSSIDIKEKLLQVKDKLLKGSFMIETFNDDISKMLELKNDLTTNV